jgi:hypothetical protein
MGFKYSENDHPILMASNRVRDAGSAQAAARRFLAAHFGADKLKRIVFSKTWYTQGAQKDLWEVEGDVVLKRRWIGKENVHFKFQVDPETGRIIAFEV